jgi:hypothetical protein
MINLKIKLITCRGKLKKGNIVNWFDETKRIISGDANEFIFIIEGDELFPNLYKYIQDNNKLEFLVIDNIQEIVD